MAPCETEKRRGESLEKVIDSGYRIRTNGCGLEALPDDEHPENARRLEEHFPAFVWIPYGLERGWCK